MKNGTLQICAAYKYFTNASFANIHVSIEIMFIGNWGKYEHYR
jgi:hypothetical protein